MASIAGLTFSTAAIAGNIEIPETITVAPVASTAADWSGFYVGGMAGRDNGTLAYSNSPGSNPPPQFYYPSIATYGGLAGFNVQRGNLVFGGEAAIHSGGMFIEPFDNEATSAIIDLKGRVGFAVGNALVFGVIGYSMTDWTTAETYDVGGVSYGAGLDYLLGEHLFVGFEYLMRDMSGPRADDPNRIGHSAIQSAAVRVGWKF